MLLKLKIKNIALIDESVIEFNKGLNILSGETGAGKSLIIDSLNFVLGARADKTLVKNGEDFASVEAVFLVDDLSEEILSTFEFLGVEPENTIIISRYMNLNGKNEIKVNGVTVTNSMLKKLTVLLVDIHGQHAHQSLLEVKNHIEILDSFNQTDIQKLKSKLQIELSKLSDINSSIADIGGTGADRERNIDLISYQIKEIEMAELKEAEEEELIARKKLLLNSEKIHESLQLANDVLSENEYSAVTAIKSAINNLKNIVSFDEEIELYHKKLESIYYELLDETEKVSDKLSSIEFSEDELNQIEERLDLLKSIKRKYGSSFEEVMKTFGSLQTKLDMLVNADEKLKNLLSEKSKVLKSIYNVCSDLTNIRKQTSISVEKQIVQELNDLGMKKASFGVEFTNNYDLENIEKQVTHSGADSVEFMFSANIGEPLKPLSKIISGGEMSRFMLAIKCVINENTNKTFIFDEIDNGIGGIVGTIVAKKLYSLGVKNQVICVTHLAQIASFASSNYKITKFVENDKTKTKVELLNDMDKISEISRLLGSDPDSSVGQLHAQELIDNAKKFIV